MVARNDIANNCGINENAFLKMELAFIFRQDTERKRVHLNCQGKIRKDQFDLVEMILLLRVEELLSPVIGGAVCGGGGGGSPLGSAPRLALIH